MFLVLLLLACPGGRGCSCDGIPAVQDVSFATPELRQIGGRFRGQPDEVLPPDLAFRAQGTCPTLSRAVVTRQNDVFSSVEVWGTGLDRVVSVSAQLEDGKMADAQFERRNLPDSPTPAADATPGAPSSAPPSSGATPAASPSSPPPAATPDAPPVASAPPASAPSTAEDGAPSLVFPIACKRCEIALGVRADSRLVACMGPGYSLRIENGRLVE
jgi:hypothetical protein